MGVVLPVLVQTLPRSDKANLLAIVLGVGMAFFLAIEPTQEWLLLVLAGLAALGGGGVLPPPPTSPSGGEHLRLRGRLRPLLRGLRVRCRPAGGRVRRRAGQPAPLAGGS